MKIDGRPVEGQTYRQNLHSLRQKMNLSRPFTVKLQGSGHDASALKEFQPGAPLGVAFVEHDDGSTVVARVLQQASPAANAGVGFCRAGYLLKAINGNDALVKHTNIDDALRARPCSLTFQRFSVVSVLG